MIILIAATIGQTTVDSSPTGPVLSEWAKEAQARALAEFRANENTIKPRLTAYYQHENERLKLANQRLMDRIEAENIGTRRLWAMTSGTMEQAAYQYQEPWESHSFSSVPSTENLFTSGRQYEPSLEELRGANFLLKGHLRDSQALYRQANRFYWFEYPIRYRLAGLGVVR
jgi:hypothetical protein